MLKLITETTKQPALPAEAEANGDVAVRHESFMQDLENLFVALMALMRNPMPVLLGTQTLVIQHFHTWLPQLQGFMSPTDIMEIATNLLDACAQAQGQMILYRLVLILRFNELDMFKGTNIFFYF